MVDAMTDADCSIMVVDAMPDFIAWAFCFFSFDKVAALIALLISILSFGFSYYFWSKSFRPIVTAMVKTAGDDDRKKVFKLQILNSGSLPAKNIRLWAKQSDLDVAFGKEASKEGKSRWVDFFSPEKNIIDLLQNNANMSCPFGYSKENDEGFWKYNTTISITIKYESWFGTRLWFGKYEETQEITIVDSESFTNYVWGGI